MLSPQQEKRINTAISHIIRTPSAPHCLEELADRAHYSEFHFHRLFKLYTGQTPGQFVWQQRLERAARILAYHRDQKITEVAEACGFSSAANFARTFRQCFGITASDIRGNADYLRANYRTVQPSERAIRMREQVFARTQQFARDYARKSDSGIVDQAGFYLRHSPDYRVAYFRNVGRYQKSTLDAISDSLREHLIDLLPDPTIIGVPRSHPGLTPDHRCYYDICWALPASVDPPTHVPTQTIPGGLNAVYRCEISKQDFYYYCQSIWGWLYNNWLPRSGFRPDNRPFFERYLLHPGDTERDHYLLEFTIPVHPVDEPLLLV